MKTNHTPGPWTVHRPTRGGFLWVCAGEVMSGAVRPPSICKVNSHYPGDKWNNARLIAEAPAMFEALQATLAHAEQMTCELEKTDDLSEFPYIQTARAILARITGGQNEGKR